jgi:hypothetical protein
MINKILDKLNHVIGSVGGRLPGAGDFDSTVRSDGSPAPNAGVDIVSARREEALNQGLPNFRSENINRTVSSLEELDHNALIILECEFEEDREWLSQVRLMTPHERLAILCSIHLSRWFARAIYELTSFPVLGIGVLGEKATRYVNRDSNGSLIDASGYVSISELREAIGDERIEVLGPVDLTDLECDDTMAFVMEMIAHMEHEPFLGLRSKALLWVKEGTLRPWIP